MNYEDKLQSILYNASKDRKQDYKVYEMYKRQIESLNLDWKQYEQVICKLANALKV